MIHRIKRDFPNPDNDKFNMDLMEHRGEKPLQEFIVNCFKSIHSTLEEIELINWTFVTDVDKVSQSNYERTRSNRAADKEQKYTYTSYSRLGELTMKFKVDLKDNPLATKKKVLYYTVRELIPIEIDGCYFLNGTRYPIQYQLTERSTYVTSGALVCKALMGIKLSKDKVQVRDHQDNLYILNKWGVNMFNGVANVAYFFLSHMGWYDFLHFFQIHKLVNLTMEETRDPNYTYFKINPPLFLKVDSRFLSNRYVMTLVGTILAAMPPHVTYEEILDKKTWVARVGSTKKNSPKESHYELGTRYRKLFNRMLDDSSIEAYELTDYNKKDILHILRWMIQENAPLHEKDNLNILNKRPRRNEVIASLVNGVISEKIKKFVNTSVKTEEKLHDEYNKLFSYKGTEVLSKMHRSGLAKWDDTVNDMDMFNRYKVTLTGPNAIGNKNPRNVSSRMKSLDPSHIGIISLDVCGASNPGMNNYFNMLCETDGLRFKGRPPEPETFGYEWRKLLLNETIDESGDVEYSLSFGDPVKFNNIMDIYDDIKIYGVGEKKREVLGGAMNLG